MNGTEVTFKDAKFFTYLKLYLLSGQSFLDSHDEWEFWDQPQDVRNALLDGNEGRGMMRRGGRFDFTGLTGLTFKYRDGLGIGIEEESWSSDIREFEDVGRKPASASFERLQHALDLYGRGVDTVSWRKDPTYKKCSGWIKARLAILKQYRDEIEAELERRPGSEESRQAGAGTIRMGDAPGELSDEGTHHEISGSTELSGEPVSAGTSSTPAGESVREVLGSDATDARGKEAPRTDQGSQEGASGGDEKVIELFADSEKRSSMSTFEMNSNDNDQRPSGLPVNRTVTALGVVVAATIVILIFAAGYWIAMASNQLRTPSDRGGGQLSSRSEGSPPLTNKKSVTREEPITRAPQTTVALEDLFLKNLAHISARASSDEVVIGRQLFSHYIWAETGPDETVPAYKLDGEYSSVTCVVGVPDEDTSLADRDNTVVIFEADGRVLKRLSAKQRNATAVTLPVRGVRVLAISFHAPVVIAAPKAHR